MSLKEVEDIQKEYSKKYNKLERELSSDLTSSDFLNMENEQLKVCEIIDIADDLIDAYKDEDLDDISVLEEKLKGLLK